MGRLSRRSNTEAPPCCAAPRAPGDAASLAGQIEQAVLRGGRHFHNERGGAMAGQWHCPAVAWGFCSRRLPAG